MKKNKKLLSILLCTSALGVAGITNNSVQAAEGADSSDSPQTVAEQSVTASNSTQQNAITEQKQVTVILSVKNRLWKYYLTMHLNSKASVNEVKAELKKKGITGVQLLKSDQDQNNNEVYVATDPLYGAASIKALDLALAQGVIIEDPAKKIATHTMVTFEVVCGRGKDRKTKHITLNLPSEINRKRLSINKYQDQLREYFTARYFYDQVGIQPSNINFEWSKEETKVILSGRAAESFDQINDDNHDLIKGVRAETAGEFICQGKESKVYQSETTSGMVVRFDRKTKEAKKDSNDLKGLLETLRADEEKLKPYELKILKLKEDEKELKIAEENLKTLEKEKIAQEKDRIAQERAEIAKKKAEIAKERAELAKEETETKIAPIRTKVAQDRAAINSTRLANVEKGMKARSNREAQNSMLEKLFAKDNPAIANEQAIMATNAKNKTKFAKLMRRGDYDAYAAFFDPERKKIDGRVAELTPKLLLDLFLGMKTISENGVVHLDIKPENLMLVLVKNQETKEFRAFYIDFGSACHQGDQTHIAGTPKFIAPEMAEDWHNGKLSIANSKMDVYSLGVTLISILLRDSDYMVAGMQSQDMDNFDAVCTDACNKDGIIATNQIRAIQELGVQHVNKTLIDLLEKMVSFDPNERPTTEECFEKAQEIKSIYEYVEQQNEPTTDQQDEATVVNTTDDENFPESTIVSNYSQETIVIDGECSILDLVKKIEQRDSDDQLDDVEGVIIVNNDDSSENVEIDSCDLEQTFNELAIRLQKGQIIRVVHNNN